MFANSIGLKSLVLFTVVITQVICKKYLVETADDKLKENKKQAGAE